MYCSIPRETKKNIVISIILRNNICNSVSLKIKPIKLLNIIQLSPMVMITILKDSKVLFPLLINIGYNVIYAPIYLYWHVCMNYYRKKNSKYNCNNAGEDYSLFSFVVHFRYSFSNYTYKEISYNVLGFATSANPK
jgi:hypothetical protein